MNRIACALGRSLGAFCAFALGAVALVAPTGLHAQSVSQVSQWAYSVNPATGNGQAAYPGDVQIPELAGAGSNCVTADVNGYLGRTACSAAGIIVGTPTTGDVAVFASPSTIQDGGALGTAAFANIGTSGATVPKLSTSNSWGAAQTFLSDTFFSASTATTLFVYTEFKPTDFGTGKPELFIQKTATANVWALGVYDGTNNNGGLKITDQWTQTSVPSTVAALPSAATAGTGARAFVVDATSCTFAATVAGGGATACPVYSDGTNWKAG